jgi:hypothetical protein
LYCEYCIKNYLETKFSNWTSGNDNLDDLIQECQIKSLHPSMVVEWIPYNNLQNIKYLNVDALKFIQQIGLVENIMINGALQKNN